MTKVWRRRPPKTELLLTYHGYKECSRRGKTYKRKLEDWLDSVDAQAELIHH